MLDMHFFRNPAFSTGTGGMILVFVAMYGVMFLISQYFQLVLGYSALTTALRLLPIVLIMLVVAPFTPRLSARFGAHRTVACGMLSIAARPRDVQPPDAALVVRNRRDLCRPAHPGVALVDVSDDRVDHVGGAPGRAGAGSAMNDATRELGAALGIAVLGSIAASQYCEPSPRRARSGSRRGAGTASSSIAGALQVAE